MVCSGENKQVLLCHYCLLLWNVLYSEAPCLCTLDILLFDKLLIAPFICQSIQHVLIPLFTPACLMSDQGVLERKQASLVTPSYLFYFITVQMTNKTLFLRDFSLTDKAARVYGSFWERHCRRS